MHFKMKLICTEKNIPADQMLQMCLFLARLLNRRIQYYYISFFQFGYIWYWHCLHSFRSSTVTFRNLFAMPSSVIRSLTLKNRPDAVHEPPGFVWTDKLQRQASAFVTAVGGRHGVGLVACDCRFACRQGTALPTSVIGWEVGDTDLPLVPVGKRCTEEIYHFKNVRQT